MRKVVGAKGRNEKKCRNPCITWSPVIPLLKELKAYKADFEVKLYQGTEFNCSYSISYSRDEVIGAHRLCRAMPCWEDDNSLRV